MKRFLFIPLFLTACGPISAERAADLCEDRARAATGPTGEIGVGINNKGKTSAKVELGISSDYIRGRDPYRLYDECVRQKTGQGPIRPLIL